MGLLSGPGVVRVPSTGVVPGTILNSDGNPYRAPRDPLASVQASSVVGVFRDLPISPVEHDWTVAEVRGALVEHALGMFTRSAILIDSIIADDRVQSALGSRVGALLGLEEVIEDSDDDADPEVTDAWREAWPRCHAPADQGETLDTIKRTAHMGGLHVSEIVWDTSSTPWQPYLKPWHLQHFYFDLSRRCLVALTEDGPLDVVPGDGKWFVHAPAGIYRGWITGLIRPLALPWLLRSFARRDWASYSERHGMPQLLAKVPAMADAKDKAKFETDLQSMGSEAVIVLPQGLDGEGFDLDLLEAASQSWEGFDRLIMRCDSHITLAVQWQNLTTEVKEGSLAAARVHSDVKQSAVELDDRTLAHDVRWQIARPFAAFNYGKPKAAPITRRDVEVLDDYVAALQGLTNFGNAVAALVNAGVRFDVVELARAYRIKGLKRAEMVAKAVVAGAKPADAAKEAVAA